MRALLNITPYSLALITVLGSLGVVRAEEGKKGASGEKPKQGSSFAIGFQGIYNSPLKPIGAANLLSDGFGVAVLPEIQFNDFFGMGVGYNHLYMYSPGGPALRVATVDLTTRFRLPVGSGAPCPYVLADFGVNVLSKDADHWRGDDLFDLGLGSRIPIVPGTDLDLGVHHTWLCPAPNDLQILSVRLGMAFEVPLGKPQATPTAQESPSPTPTHGTPTPGKGSATPTVALTSTLVPVEPTSTPTPTVTLQATGTATVSPPSPTPQATLESAARMRDDYDKGIAAFKAEQYRESAVWLKKAVEIKDPSVVYWYYAEANAMLGVIYHLHAKGEGHLDVARQYYKAALKIDPQTRTALKGMKALSAQPTRGLAR